MFAVSHITTFFHQYCWRNMTHRHVLSRWSQIVHFINSAQSFLSAPIIWWLKMCCDLFFNPELLCQLVHVVHTCVLTPDTCRKALAYGSLVWALMLFMALPCCICKAWVRGNEWWSQIWPPHPSLRPFYSRSNSPQEKQLLRELIAACKDCRKKKEKTLCVFSLLSSMSLCFPGAYQSKFSSRNTSFSLCSWFVWQVVSWLGK